MRSELRQKNEKNPILFGTLPSLVGLQTEAGERNHGNISQCVPFVHKQLWLSLFPSAHQ